MSVTCQTLFINKRNPPCRYPASWRNNENGTLVCHYHSNPYGSRTALNAFGSFSDETFVVVLKANPTFTPDEVIDKLYAEWNNMSDTDKKQWEETTTK
jgi:hypothetical protein